MEDHWFEVVDLLVQDALRVAGVELFSQERSLQH